MLGRCLVYIVEWIEVWGYLSNFYLPIEIVKNTYYETETQEIEYTVEEAKEILIAELEKQLEQEIENKESITNKQVNVYESEGNIEIELIYEVLETIGVDEKIIFWKGWNTMEERSLRVYETNKKFFSKIGNTITKLFIPTKIGINGMLISMKRNNVLKAYETFNKDDEKTKKMKDELLQKYEDVYTLYLEALDKYIMD